MYKISSKNVEVISNKLYWVSLKNPPVNISNALYFSTDKELTYKPFFFDFGPLNINYVILFINELERILKEKQKRIIFHYTSLDTKKKINSAFLMGCFMVS